MAAHIRAACQILINRKDAAHPLMPIVSNAGHKKFKSLPHPTSFMSDLKHIVLFGAGKSATVLIEYLKQLATENIWKITVADSNLEAAQSKVGVHAFVKAVPVNTENIDERREWIEQADLVISLMPPHLHYLLALDCI